MSAGLPALCRPWPAATPACRRQRAPAASASSSCRSCPASRRSRSAGRWCPSLDVDTTPAGSSPSLSGDRLTQQHTYVTWHNARWRSVTTDILFSAMCQTTRPKLFTSSHRQRIWPKQLAKYAFPNSCITNYMHIQSNIHSVMKMCSCLVHP